MTLSGTVCAGRCGLRTPSRCRDTAKEHTRLACKSSEVESWLARTGRGQLDSADVPPMLEQSSTGRTYTRDAYAPVRRDAHAEVEEITAGSIPAPFHFFNFEESVLDRSETRSAGNDRSFHGTGFSCRAVFALRTPNVERRTPTNLRKSRKIH